MPTGPLGNKRPNAQEIEDIEQALRLLHAIGEFDVGQAAVVAGNHVLAVEGAEGTDRMLERVCELRSRQIGASGGVLVKAPKPGQDWRFDLPSIGPQTVEGAVRAGLGGVAVVAGGSIIAEPQRVTELADRHNVFVVGVSAEGTFG
jgi:DUF1009 family protein